MTKNYCTTNHKYGPFKENENFYYRTCQLCNKKTIYAKCDEIKEEIKRQTTASKLCKIILKLQINIIKDANIFIKLTACLLDDISYIYLSPKEKDTLLKNINNLNIYFHQSEEDSNLINDTIKYLNTYFNTKYDQQELIELDNLYNNLQDRFFQKIIDISNQEESNLNISSLPQDNQLDQTNFNYLEEVEENS